MVVIFRKSGITLIALFMAISTIQAQFSIDAQFRNRFEVRDGYQKLTADGAAPAVFISQRTRVTFSYQTENLRLKFTPQDVRVWGDEQLTSSTGVFGNEASLDLFEGFAEIRTSHSGWLSIGRQQLIYDNQRILAARNWNQAGIAYDAIVYKLAPEGWDIHLGSSWNSTGENNADNLYAPDRIKSLNFLWAKHTLAEGWDLSLSHITSGVTKSETESTLRFKQTTGLYTTFKSGDWNLWANAYYQFGKNQSGNHVSASLIDVETSCKTGKLTTAAGIGYLSGNSKTGAEQTTDHLFDILYGARHRVYGSIDYFRNPNSSTKQGGMADALSGTVDLGMFSRAIAQEEKNKGVWWVAVTKDAVIPTMNTQNPVLSSVQKRGLTPDEFKKIYITGEIKNWNQIPGIETDQAINVFTRSDACGAAETWAAYLGGKQEDLQGIGIFGDPGLADTVVKDVKGIGFNNTIYLYEVKTGKKNAGIDVIPIDVNENGMIDTEEAFYDEFDQILTAIAEGKYPSPPARELYFVAKGKPQKQATIDFLKWVVSKGQAYVPEAGYVPLTKARLDEEAAKLSN